MADKNNPPKIITVASIVGIVLAALGLGASGLEAFFMLTVIPVLLCVGFLVKKWWICGVLYCIVFLIARSNMFLGRVTLLAVILNLLIVTLFVYATKAACIFKKETTDHSANE